MLSRTGGVGEGELLFLLRFEGLFNMGGALRFEPDL